MSATMIATDHQSNTSTATTSTPVTATTSNTNSGGAGTNPSASGSTSTSSPEKPEDDGEKPKARTQTCFRCRQSKVKCVFEDNAPSCRRCVRLGVNCELQGKREPLSWQMRVQHQLAALEGSLQSFMEKQMGSEGQGSKRQSFPRSRDEGAFTSVGEGQSKKRRRTTIANDSHQQQQQQRTPTANGGIGYSHSNTDGSPLYADSSYPSTTQHFSPRDVDRSSHHHHHSTTATDSNGLLGSLVGGNGYSNSPKPRMPLVDTAAVAGSTHLISHPPSSSIVAADHNAALPDEDPVGGPSTGDDRAGGAFSTEDDSDQASRPLSSIQKLRMSVLDRKKELSRSSFPHAHEHDRIFPNLYRLATSDLGSKDPRPNVIKQDLVSPSDAVVLFRFFAEYLDQYSFGFPTYRPDAIMSPMILTSVVCVASLHHAQLNRLHMPLKGDLIARLQTDDPSFPCSDVYETLFSSSAGRASNLQSNLHFEKELDPELGIGVEEIVGASLFGSWFGGRRAWMASRLARWWSAKFLRQQQHPAMMTMGEIMSILPPPRDLGKQDLLRVWLSAYITEIHQACMEGTPSIAGLSSPHAVCDSLQYGKGLSQRTSLRDRVLILHAKVSWILSRAYHIAGGGSGEWGKEGVTEKGVASKESPSRSCNSCNRDGSTNDHHASSNSASAGGAGNDAASCLQAVLDAFEELDSCQEEMAGRLDADAIGESESMLYLDLFLARVLIASIGCDFLDSTLWDGSLGQNGSSRGRDKNSAEADLHLLRSRTLRESLTRGVEGALRSLELVCLPTLSNSNAGKDGRNMHEVSLNVLVLPIWFHWALTRSVLFLMNVLAEYPERLLPRDRSRSVELINMFLDLYSKHIGHANMVLSHGNGSSRRGESGGYGAAWSPSDDTRDPRHGSSGAGASNGATAGMEAAAAGGAQNGWQAGGQDSSSNSIQHPATPLLDTLTQCLTWARHGGVM